MELIELIYEVSFNVISSIFLVKYYASFLTLKSGKRIFSLTCFGATYLLFRYISGQLLSMIITNNPALTLTKFIVMAGIVFGLSFVFFKKDLNKQVFLLCSFLAVQDICIFISTSLGTVSMDMGGLLFSALLDSGVLNTTEQVTEYFNILIVINLIIHILIFSIVSGMVLRGITKSFIYKNYSLQLSELLSLILPCLSGLSITHILRAIIYMPDGGGLQIYYENPNVNILVFLAAVFLLLTLLASVKLFQKTIQLHIEEKNAAVFQKQMQQLQEQIRDVDGIYTEIRGMRHDMKSHISNIRLLVKAVMEGNQEVHKELEEYLGKFEDTLNKFEFAYQTGNSVSDIIIHQNYVEASNNGIDFSADFIYPARLNFDAYDLAVILNNAFENAIEACNNMTQPDRFIRLYAYTKGEMFFIEVENSFSGHIALDERNDLPTSSKPDKTAHGMGLSNIQRCARKYFGDIEFQITEAEKYNVFRLTVMLQGRS